MKKLNLLLALLICSTSNLKAEEWEKTLEKDGITVYKKDSKKSDIQSLKAEGIVGATVEKITTLLRDTTRSTKWVPNLLVRNVIRDISDTEAILHDVTDMPWPITDRDTVVRHILSITDDKKSLILNFKSVSNKIRSKIDKYVRAKISHGYLKFTPMGDKTHIEMSILVDPKGSIPSWAVNVVQVSMPYDFIKALDKFSNKHELPTPKGISRLLAMIKKSPNT